MKAWIKANFNKIAHHNFTKYLATSIIITISTTAIIWFSVNILGFLASITNIALRIFNFLTKYSSYHKTGMFTKGKQHMFAKYFISWLIVTGLTTIILWLSSDIIGWSVIVINPVATIFGFILNFYLFHLFGMLSKNN
jgi:hypothetical protein